jgi:hypothetical protein
MVFIDSGPHLDAMLSSIPQAALKCTFACVERKDEQSHFCLWGEMWYNQHTVRNL